MNKSAIFKLENVGFSVDGLNILNDISLEIENTDFMVLLGPSGSGKSTLLRMLNCLNSPTSGNLYFYGKLLAEYDIAALRKKVGMVFQSPTMINGTVKENLILTQLWEDNSQAIEEGELITILDKVGLDSTFLTKDALSLSGGEQQRIALARVLLNKPKVLLLDEPTANLDPQLANKIIKLIYKLYKEFDLTVVLISHNYGIIKQFAQRVVFLIDGQIEEEGNSIILERPQTDSLKSFVAQGEE